MNIFDLSPAEREIMEILWNEGGKSNSELLKHLNTCGRDWKRQTLNTLLTRLISKNMVYKKSHSFSAKCTKSEFDQLQAQSILSSVYDGSLSKFVIALKGNTELTEEDADSLKEVLKSFKEED